MSQTKVDKDKDEEDVPLVAPKETVKGTSQMQALKAAEEEEALSKKRSIGIQTEQTEALLAAYRKHCGEDWFKKNPPEQDKDGRITLTFKSEEDMTQFFQEQAKSGQNFTMVDAKTNKVFAYANGDGKLYTIGKDGPKEYTGGPLLPKEEDMKYLPDVKDFKVPSKDEPVVESGAKLN